MLRNYLRIAAHADTVAAHADTVAAHADTVAAHAKILHSRSAAPPPRRWSSFTPLQVASLYGFPAGTGAGQTIGVVQLGGGFRASDMQAYFASLGLAVPTIRTLFIGGARNNVGD